MRPVQLQLSRNVDSVPARTRRPTSGWRWANPRRSPLRAPAARFYVPPSASRVRAARAVWRRRRDSRRNSSSADSLLIRGSIIAMLAFLIVGCGTPRMYDGPALPQDQVSTVSVSSGRATITRVDGGAVNKSAIELLPGRYEIDFSWSTRSMIGSLFPVMTSDCHVEVTLDAGRKYSFEQNESREAVGKRPPQNFRWTIYRIDPKLISDSGSEVGNMTCNPTCRAHGRKSSNEQTLACSHLLEPRVVSPVEDSPRLTPEEAALSRIIFDRLQSSCSELRGTKELECQLRRVPNNISYLSEDGTLLIFYPHEQTHLRPGLRDEARSECLGSSLSADTFDCLHDFGWVLLE